MVADKTGGVDSGPLFAAVHTAYEALATSRHRALYKPPTSSSISDLVEFSWVVELPVEPTAGAISSDLSSVAKSYPTERCESRSQSEKEGDEEKKLRRHRMSSSMLRNLGSNIPNPFQDCGKRSKRAMGNNEARQGDWRAPGENTPEEEEGGSDFGLQRQCSREATFDGRVPSVAGQVCASLSPDEEGQGRTRHRPAAQKLERLDLKPEDGVSGSPNAVAATSGISIYPHCLDLPMTPGEPGSNPYPSLTTVPNLPQPLNQDRCKLKANTPGSNTRTPPAVVPSPASCSRTKTTAVGDLKREVATEGSLGGVLSPKLFPEKKNESR